MLNISKFGRTSRQDKTKYDDFGLNLFRLINAVFLFNFIFITIMIKLSYLCIALNGTLYDTVSENTSTTATTTTTDYN